MPKLLLAGRPGHTSSTEDVKVDVEDILSRIFGRVENDSVSTLLDSLFLCNLPRLGHDVSQKARFLFGDVVQGCEMLFGYEQNMNGRLGIYVVKS